jgi:hypothetical protein
MEPPRPLDPAGADLGDGDVDGFKARPDSKMRMVSEPSSSVDPAIESQIPNLGVAGANIFFDQTTPKLGAADAIHD